MNTITFHRVAPIVIGATVALLGGCPQQNQDLIDDALATVLQSNLTVQKLTPVATDDPAAGIASEDPSAPPQTGESEFPLPDAQDPSAVTPIEIEGTDSRPAEPAFFRTPFGLWLLEDGALLPEFDPALKVTAISIEDDGFGRVFFRDFFTDANDCARAFVLYDGRTLALDLSAEPGAGFNPNRTMFFPVVVIDNDTLGLADENGQIALFSRQTQLPPDVDCGQLEVVETFDGLPVPHSFGDLTLHFGDLIYNSNADQIERFDLDTGTLGAPVGPTDRRFIQTKQGIDFWTHCGCGGSPEIVRRTLISELDTVHTGNDLNRQITIRAAEYLPTTDRLWLHGRSSSNSRFQFLVVNTNGEPDTLEQAIDFNRDLRGLSFDGTDFWGIVTMASPTIVRIDLETARVVESFEVPDEEINWTGLEFVDGAMYLIGSDNNTQGVLVRLAQP